MRMQRIFAPALVIAAALAMAVPALGDADVDGSPGLPDLDVRTGAIPPTAAQRAGAKALGADVSWNEFGTPSTLVRPGGALGATVGGDTATSAARTWLEGNRGLFRLSSATGLEPVNDSTLAGKATHAVTFRQAPGGLDVAGGGLVTIGVTKAGGAWRVVSASSTISGDETIAPGGARLSDAQAWQRAARSVGRHTSLARVQRVSIRKLGLGSGWKGLRVAGFSNVQQSRKVAFPTLTRGYVPAFETLVLDTAGAEPAAYRVIVDAQSGAVLSRESLVDNEGEPTARAAQAPADPNSLTFSGTLPATDGGCDTPQGPLTVSADSGGRAIDVFADATTPAQDIVLNLLQGTKVIASADTLRTPERIRFEPGGTIPAGQYFAQVCEFGPDGVPPVEPRTYTGTISLDTTAAPAAFLARWRAFPANPPLNTLAQDPWNNPSTDTRENWCWRQSPNAADCNRVVGNLASRSPWDFDPKTNTVTNTTIGNNAKTAESWTDDTLPGPNQFRPVSTARDYSFPWTNAWFNQDCNPGTPYGANFVVGQSFDVSAAVTNLFVQHNRMHDFSYLLGFTEDNWNAQNSNFGLTEAFRENDPVVGDTQSGATIPPEAGGPVRDNANMITLPDGSSSITNMYLWQPIAGAFYAPCVDGDYDAGVIGHEYTHMIENRTIGKGANRSGFQAGAMGEAAGDLFSIEQLNENGFVPTSDENPFATGTYATGNKLRGIRNYAANFPYTGAFPEPGIYPRVDPQNFSDVGYDVTGPEVHADGEIWVAINFELRRALAAKYNAQFPESDRQLQASCAAGTTPVTSCPGNRRWIQLLFDAFLLMPTAPSMVDARNAILAADQARFGGADIPTLWAAFARRGLGRFASQTNGSGRTRGVESDRDPLPDFEAVGQPNARVTFRARNAAGGAAPNARIYVGHYEARVSPIADTDPATNEPATASANNLDETAVFAPGTYEFIATAPGFGAVRFRQTFTANQSRTITLQMAPNLASAAAGATATGDAAPVTNGTREVQGAPQVLRNLIDDTEATDWQSAARQAPDGSWVVNGNKVTVDLAGTAPERVNRVQVSAALGPVFDATANTDLTQNRFTAVRRFEIWSCNARVADCTQDDNYQRAFISGADAFPADAPRPVAPMLLLRTFSFSAVRATHLRIVVDSSQCTDGPAYQGEQDADPFNATDCNSAGPATTRFVRVAELQAYGAASRVQ